MTIGRTLWLLACLAALPALERIDWRTGDGCVRPGMLFTGVLSCAGLPPGRYVLETRVQGDGQELHASRLADLTAAELATGVEFRWIAEILVPISRCRLDAVVLRSGGEPVAAGEQVLPLWSQLVRNLADRIAALERAGHAADPQVRLLIEQGALQVSERPDQGAARRLLERLARLEDWRPSPPAPLVPGANPGVLVDAIDGGVHPWRVYLPPTDGRRALAIVCRSGADWSKDRWPELPAALVAEALAAGIVLIEPYPGGDRWWQGAAPRRAWQLLGELRKRDAALYALPRLLVAVGNGYAGLLRLVGNAPDAFVATLAIAPALDGLPVVERPPAAAGDAAFLRAYHDPERHLAQLRQLPHTVADIGEADTTATASLQRLRREGVEWLETPLAPVDPALWRTLLGTVGTPPARRGYTVVEPGIHGPFLVTAMARWGVPGSLDHAVSEGKVTTAGLGGLRLGGAWQGSPPVIDGRPYAEPVLVAAGRKGFGRPSGPLGSLGRRPFVVVYGTGDHLLAQERNRLLAAALVKDWAAYAQGQPPIFADTDFADADHRDYDLVLVGDPAANGVLADLASDLPLTWTNRELRMGDRVWERRTVTGLAVAWPHPDGRRLLVVLEGAPVWDRGRGHPFFGLGDLVVEAGEAGRLHLVADDAWNFSR